LFHSARLMAGRFLFGVSTNQLHTFVIYLHGNVYGGYVVKKNAGEFVKHVAAIIAARWIRKSDDNKTETKTRSKKKDGTNNGSQR